MHYWVGSLPAREVVDIRMERESQLRARNGMTGFARSPVLPEATLVGTLSAHSYRYRMRQASAFDARVPPLFPVLEDAQAHRAGQASLRSSFADRREGRERGPKPRVPALIPISITCAAFEAITATVVADLAQTDVRPIA